MTTIAANISKNETLPSHFQVISRPVVIYMRSQSSIIVILNFIVLLTLTTKKRKFPAVYWLQIVCLAFNDMLAGVANFLISFIDLPYIKDSLTNCSIAIVFLYSSQSASLYSIFGICIHRFTVLKRSDASSNVWKHKHTLVCTSLAWTLSLSLCSFPVLVYSKPDGYNKIKFCSVQPLFGADVKKGMLILMGSFVVPLIFTNAMYVTLFCVLKSTWKTIKPDRSATNSEVGSLCSVSAFLNEFSKTAMSNRTTTCTTIPNQSFSSKELPAGTELQQLHEITKISKSQYRAKRSQSFCSAKVNSKHAMMKRQKSVFLKIPERQKSVQLISVKSLDEPTPSTSASQIQSASKNFRSIKSRDGIASISHKPLTQVRQTVPQTLMRQRKAYALVGIILLFLNIFTWPGIAALFLAGMVNTISLGRGILLPLFTTICVNSAVNPILYTATIPEFREALFDILFGIYKLMKC